LRLLPDLRLTPEQFALVCTENREAVLELAADGRLISMTPVGSETGARPSAQRNAAASRPSAPIWWWNWLARTTKALEA
jgi:hypothetical protein